MRAYKKLPQLYDVAVLVATLDQGQAGVQGRFDAQGVSFANAQRLTQHYLDAYRWMQPPAALAARRRAARAGRGDRSRRPRAPVVAHRPLAGDVGRALDNTVVLSDAHVAAHHATVDLFAPPSVSATTLDADLPVERRPTSSPRPRIASHRGRDPKRRRHRPRSPARRREPRRRRHRRRPRFPDRPHAASPAPGRPRARPPCSRDPGGRRATSDGCRRWRSRSSSSFSCSATPGSTPIPTTSRARPASIVLTTIAAGAIWCGLWALLSKTFTRQGHFGWHVRVFVIASLATMVLAALPPLVAFAFSWPWVTDFSFVAVYATIAAAIYFHLLAVEPSRVRLMRGGGDAGFLAGVALTLWFNIQRTGRPGEELYMNHLFPPQMRIARPVLRRPLVAGASAPMQAILDRKAQGAGQRRQRCTLGEATMKSENDESGSGARCSSPAAAAASGRRPAGSRPSRGWAVARQLREGTALRPIHVVAAIVAAGGRGARSSRADVAERGPGAGDVRDHRCALPPLGALVNNAGVVDRQGRVDTITVERLQRMFAINVFGSFECAREAVKRMSRACMGAPAAASSTCPRPRPASVRPGSTWTTRRPRARSTCSRSAWPGRSRPKGSASTRCGPASSRPPSTPPADADRPPDGAAGAAAAGRQRRRGRRGDSLADVGRLELHDGRRARRDRRALSLASTSASAAPVGRCATRRSLWRARVGPCIRRRTGPGPRRPGWRRSSRWRRSRPAASPARCVRSW